LSRYETRDPQTPIPLVPDKIDFSPAKAPVSAHSQEHSSLYKKIADCAASVRL